jgi:hypothetical protein
MVLTGVEKFVMVVIGELEVMANRCFGCTKDYATHDRIVCRVSGNLQQ